MQTRERGATIIEAAIVALAAGLMIVALVGARAAINYAKKSQSPRMGNAVGAAFQAYVEAEGRLPGDADGDGRIEGVELEGPPGPATAGVDDDAVLVMVMAGYLDGSFVEEVPGVSLGADDRLVFPGGVPGVLRTTTAIWPGRTVHAVLLDCGNGTELTVRIDEVMDDGNPATGLVKRESGGPPWRVWVAIMGTGGGGMVN